MALFSVLVFLAKRSIVLWALSSSLVALSSFLGLSSKCTALFKTTITVGWVSGWIIDFGVDFGVGFGHCSFVFGASTTVGFRWCAIIKTSIPICWVNSWIIDFGQFSFWIGASTTMGSQRRTIITNGVLFGTLGWSGCRYLPPGQESKQFS